VRRLGLLPLVLLLTLAAASGSHADTPSDCIQASTRSGPAPLDVSFQATCEASLYHWDFGDGASADGAQVEHLFAAGEHSVSLTRQLTGGSSSVTTLSITALALRLQQVSPTRYGRLRSFRGALVPARAGVPVRLMRGSSLVGRGRTRAGGRFAIRISVRSAGDYRVRALGLSSPAAHVLVRPQLQVTLDGVPALGQPLAVRATLKPASAGSLQLLVLRGGEPQIGELLASGKSFQLPTVRLASYLLHISLRPAAGYLTTQQTLRYSVVSPSLSLGSHGPLVLALERSLVAHHFALGHVGMTYDRDTVDAVYALQKLAGLPRTGRVDAATWAALSRLSTPHARLRTNYIEVDKTKQLLYVVRGGEVTLIVPVSTGATGNTPIGLWHVYSKIPGWSWVLYYPNYFLRGFAIHGYPDVPPWPASHGCVRVPMWVATRLYSLIPNGSLIDIHY
jgi:PKD repeat protein